MAGDPLRKVISREVEGLESHPDTKGHGNVTDVMIVIRREVKDQRIIVPGMKWIE